MEREILFRGKRIDNGEWDYGYPFVSDTDGSAYILRGSRELTPGHEVAPDTLKPYTGMTDKNGVKIFEGDIVRYQFDNDDCPFPDKRTDKIIGRIFFSDFRASFSVTAGRNGSDPINNDLFKYVRNGNRVEVIGNIHDNPELLEVQNGT